MKFNLLEKYLSKQESDWFVGIDLTFADFVIYEVLCQYKDLLPNLLQDFPKLSAFMDKFENVPEIKAYMKSAKRLAFNSPRAERSDGFEFD